MSIVWSFSSLKTFQQCPRKYYYAKVAPDRIREPDTTATLYGKAAHTVAEDYIGNFTCTTAVRIPETPAGAAKRYPRREASRGEARAY